MRAPKIGIEHEFYFMNAILGSQFITFMNQITKKGSLIFTSREVTVWDDGKEFQDFIKEVFEESGIIKKPKAKQKKKQ